MKISMLFFSLFFSVLSNASQTPEFISTLNNYGNYDVRKIEFELRYDSHSGGDGSCRSCIHKKIKINVGRDGKIHFPSITLDSRNTRHSFALKVNTPYTDKQVIYFCDVLNNQFGRCEDDLAEELRVISAYSFDSAPIEINFASGISLQEWLAKINDMNLQVHISDHAPKYGDSLGWNTQIFGSCKVDQCSTHEGAAFFVGNPGATPELYYEITAVESPKYFSAIPGIHGLQFSEKWSGRLPKELLSFQVNDK